ncbi:hemagglutination protein [Listeria seeligeri]|nr:hemagglutination protein [Listeria seeligeri]MBM5693834.1 hemagglutination protein [Listeria seeligeri]QPJ27923.1 hemagglutination protein [Listeria seeligeri]
MGRSYTGKRNRENDFKNGKGVSTLEKHTLKHQYDSADEYLADARQFLEKKPTLRTETFVSKEGTYFRYDAKTNEFRIINEYGSISTYFKPNAGLKYWEKQIDLYYQK